MKLTRPRVILCCLAAPLYIGAGILHFASTETFAKIVPPFIPKHRLVVYLSGIAEIAGGIGLLVPQTRRKASLRLALLLAAVFPANVYMATDNVQVTRQPVPNWMLWARLPLQAVLIWWVLWCSKPKTGQR